MIVYRQHFSIINNAICYQNQLWSEDPSLKTTASAGLITLVRPDLIVHSFYSDQSECANTVFANPSRTYRPYTLVALDERNATKMEITLDLEGSWFRRISNV